MKKYPAYKDSGVEWIGEIPEHWEVKKLKRISSIQLSSVDRHSFDHELPVGVCHYPVVYNNEKINSSLELNQGTCTHDEFEKFRLRQGDILMTKDSESPDDIGIPALVEENFENAVCGYHLAVISPELNKSDGGFLFRLIQSNPVRSYFEVHANGITRFGLGKSTIENLAIFLPPLPEQRSITSYLDHKTALIDELVEKTTQKIALLQEQRTALINQAVTKGLDPSVPMKDSGVEWIGEVPRHWEVKRLKHISDKIQTGSTPPSAKEEYFAGELNWFTPSDFSDNLKLVESQRKISRLAIADGVVKLFPGNSILIVGIGATLGKVGYIDTSAASNQQINAIVFKDLAQAKYYSNFLYANQNSVVSLSNSSTLAILNQSQTNNVFVPVPPKEELVRITELLDQVWSQINNLILKEQQKITLLKEYRQALISEVVTGKIDVRDA